MRGLSVLVIWLTMLLAGAGFWLAVYLGVIWALT